MKKIYLLLTASALCLLISSCQSIIPLSIDYMLPAEVSFPAELKKVAVVNNVPQRSAKDGLIKQEEHSKTGEESAILTQYFHGQAALTTESLAESLAHGNYFDEVIICDSVLQSKDPQVQAVPLSSEEVKTLAYDLGADVIIALEDVQIKAVRKVAFNPFYQAYLGTTDTKVVPTVRIYLPGRKTPVSTLQTSDSIFWEGLGTSFEEAEARLIRNQDLIKEASGFAGTIPAKQLLPHWQSGQRYLFTGGCVELRDAAVYVRENNWKEAMVLWEKLYQEKKGKKKMQAAHNLAVGNEMQDNLSQALDWAQKAQTIAFEIDQVEKKKSSQGVEASDAPNYALESFYVAELAKRKDKLGLLNMQMERFKE